MNMKLVIVWVFLNSLLIGCGPSDQEISEFRNKAFPEHGQYKQGESFEGMISNEKKKEFPQVGIMIDNYEIAIGSYKRASDEYLDYSRRAKSLRMRSLSVELQNKSAEAAKAAIRLTEDLNRFYNDEMERIMEAKEEAAATMGDTCISYYNSYGIDGWERTESNCSKVFYDICDRSKSEIEQKYRNYDRHKKIMWNGPCKKLLAIYQSFPKGGGSNWQGAAMSFATGGGQNALDAMINGFIQDNGLNK